jgi:CRP/FNR family cyclic AMP-dependent transcriptional regulator
VNAPRTQLLQEMAVFGGVRSDVLEFLLGLSRTVHLASGDYFFRQGGPGEVMFVLESGTVDVLREVDGHAPHLLRQLSAGDCFGEMALMDLAPRSASVRATADCVAIEISTAHLMRI